MNKKNQKVVGPGGNLRATITRRKKRVSEARQGKGGHSAQTCITHARPVSPKDALSRLGMGFDIYKHNLLSQFGLVTSEEEFAVKFAAQICEFGP